MPHFARVRRQLRRANNGTPKTPLRDPGKREKSAADKSVTRSTPVGNFGRADGVQLGVKVGLSQCNLTFLEAEALTFLAIMTLQNEIIQQEM